MACEGGSVRVGAVFGQAHGVGAYGKICFGDGHSQIYPQVLWSQIGLLHPSHDVNSIISPCTAVSLGAHYLVQTWWSGEEQYGPHPPSVAVFPLCSLWLP